MIDFYCVLVMYGKKTIESVPERYREAVIAQLASIGLDANGNPIA